MGFIHSVFIVFIVCAGTYQMLRSALCSVKEGSLRRDQNVVSEMRNFVSSEKRVQRMVQLDMEAGGEGRFPGRWFLRGALSRNMGFTSSAREGALG